MRGHKVRDLVARPVEQRAEFRQVRFASAVIRPMSCRFGRLIGPQADDPGPCPVQCTIERSTLRTRQHAMRASRDA